MRAGTVSPPLLALIVWILSAGDNVITSSSKSWPGIRGSGQAGCGGGGGGRRREQEEEEEEEEEGVVGSTVEELISRQ